MDDTISRQAAIEAYGDWYVEEGTAEGFIGTVKQLLEGLPSAERLGRWIHKDPSGTSCSKCGSLFPMFMGLYDYCPNCGAQMSPPDEE